VDEVVGARNPVVPLGIDQIRSAVLLPFQKPPEVNRRTFTMIARSIS